MESSKLTQRSKGGKSNSKANANAGDEVEVKSVAKSAPSNKWGSYAKILCAVAVLLVGGLIGLLSGHGSEVFYANPPRTLAEEASPTPKPNNAQHQQKSPTLFMDDGFKMPTGKRKRAIPLNEPALESWKNTYATDEENEQILTIMNCSSNYPSPVPGVKQKCCEVKGGKNLICLPNLVILGAQKSGTTAMHSYFLLHPELSPAKKKELHLFDFDKNFRAFADRCKVLLPQLSPEMAAQRITVDSTPSYIADHKACGRMGRILSPDTKYVLLLREPTERMWSELHMKQRRIQLQNEFLYELLPRYHKEMEVCSKTCRKPCHAKNFTACLPDQLRHHGRMSAFTKFLEDPKKEGVRFMTTCLKSSEAMIECLHGDFKDEILKEKMPPVPGIIMEEIQALTRLMTDCCKGDVNKVLERSRKGLPVNKADRPGKGAYEIPDDYGFCKGCGCHCFPRATMISDISRAYVWRSLYFPQVIHCLASIDRSKLLVLNMKDLQESPRETMSRVFQFVGLKDIDVKQYSWDEVQALFRQHYPDFENISGWAHIKKSSEDLPQKMPDDLRATVNEFLRAYNRKLFELLGIEPFEGWAV